MNSNSTCRMYNRIDYWKRNCELRFGIVVRWMDLTYRQHTGMAWRVYNRSKEFSETQREIVSKRNPTFSLSVTVNIYLCVTLVLHNHPISQICYMNPQYLILRVNLWLLKFRIWFQLARWWNRCCREWKEVRANSNLIYSKSRHGNFLTRVFYPIS